MSEASKPRPVDEAQLVRRAESGDQQAIGALLELWQPSLEKIARALLRNHGRIGFDTHDLVATAMRRALSQLGRADPNGNTLALVKEMLRSAHTDKYRSESARRRREATMQVRSPEPRMPGRLSEAMAKGLTPEDWELLLLWKQGLPWERIAATLGIDDGAARKRWQRLLARLRTTPRSRPGEPGGSVSGQAPSEDQEEPGAPGASGSPPSGR